MRALTAPWVPTGMKTGVSMTPCGGPQPAPPGDPVGGQQFEFEAHQADASRVEPGPLGYINEYDIGSATRSATAGAPPLPGGW